MKIVKISTENCHFFTYIAWACFRNEMGFTGDTLLFLNSAITDFGCLLEPLKKEMIHEKEEEIATSIKRFDSKDPCSLV